MKNLSMKFAAIVSIISFSAINICLKANAQVFNDDTLYTLQVCNDIMNLHDADPENPELTMARRECDLRAYYVNLCAASGGEFSTCWDDNYPVDHDLTISDLEIIRDNNF